jgi:hypothetical protein
VKHRFYIGIFFVLGGFTLAASYSYLPVYLSLKMSKQLNKLFDQEVLIRELTMNDTLALNHQLYEVYSADTLAGYSMITRALGCKTGGCDKPSEDSISFEQFYFFTAFDKDKNIKKVRVLEYTSDHGYQIANKGWLKQFEKGKKFSVGENIDAISGATISVKSITAGVNEQLRIIQEK